VSSAKPVLVASGRASFSKAGHGTVTVRLNGRGKRLLKNAHRLKLTAKGTFAPHAHSSVSATKTFVLH
jgi:hypothetical protein